jgi:hypothetical protein
MEEGRRQERITRTAKDPVKLRRAIVVMMSAQGQSAPDINLLIQVADDYVRDVFHAFNERGFKALDPTWICLIARTVPAEWGITGRPTWSLKTEGVSRAGDWFPSWVCAGHLKIRARRSSSRDWAASGV